MEAPPEAAAAAASAAEAPDKEVEDMEQQPDTDKSQPQQPMSKRQMKRLAKQEMVEKKKAERKVAHKAAQAAKKAEAVARAAALTPEELQAKREVRRQRAETQRAERAARRSRQTAALSDPAAQRIVVDCEFEDKMHDLEVKSLCKQLAYAYSANAQAEAPAHLVITGLQGRMADVFTQVCTGSESWLVTKSAGSYLELPQGVLPGEGGPGSLVYLSADSPNELSKLEPGKAYIVGGIVDRNRHKGICLRKAEGQGIATARLPIGQYIQLASSKVLTTNHVVEIMVKWMTLRNWQAAFEAVIPTRKRKHEDEQKEAGEMTAEGGTEEGAAEGEDAAKQAGNTAQGGGAAEGAAEDAAAKRQRSEEDPAAANGCSAGAEPA